MKKVYLLFTLCMCGYLFAAAQASLDTPVLNISKANLSSMKDNNQQSMQRRGGPLGVNHSNFAVWYDDFSTANNWTMTHAVGTNIDWTIGISPPSPVGDPYAIDEILSPTYYNGYAIFDSHYNNDPAGQVAQMTMTNPADLTGHNYVRLKFYQFYRRRQDSTFVYVSNNATTWTKYVINPKTGLFRYSSKSGAINPAAEYIDISSVAANQDSVYIRFEFYSPTTLPGSYAGNGFAWMVDDVSIEDIPDYDATNDFPTAEYLSIPFIQPEGFVLRGKVVNKGRMSFSGARIVFNVYDPLNNVVYVDSTPASGNIAPNDTGVFLTSANAYVPITPGFYQIKEWVTLPTDSDRTNDTTWAYINVSDSVYTRDYAYYDPNSFIGNLTYSGTPFTLGSVYNVYHTSQFTSARIYLVDAKIGDQLNMSVYSMSGVLPNAVIGTTPTYTIQAADTNGAYVTFVFNPPVDVTPGNYTVCVNELDTNRLTLGFTDLVFTPQKQFYKITNWVVSTAGSPMIRLNNPTSTLVNVEDGIEESYFTVYPNPTKGVISFTNNSGRSEKNITIEVVNSLGATVKKANYSFVSQGRLDVSGLPAGVYTISLSSDSKKEMKTIVLQ